LGGNPFCCHLSFDPRIGCWIVGSPVERPESFFL
jgi:hypothetical protein